MKQKISQFDEMGLVCLRNLKPNIFTTGTSFYIHYIK